MTDVKNVTTAKPYLGGGVWRAPLGTQVPTDATTQLNQAFKDMGYISEDGLTQSMSPTVENIKAWGGQVVMTSTTEKADTFKIKFIEGLNIEVLKMVFGDANVTGTFETGISIAVDAKDLEGACYVVEEVTNDSITRTVIPHGSITAISDIPHKANEAKAYEVTITALPDSNKKTHYEYIIKA